MSIYLTLSAFGLFALNEKSEIISKHVIYPDVGQAVSNLLAISNGESTVAIDAIVKEITKSGEREIIVEDPLLARSLLKNNEFTVKVESNTITKWFRENQFEYLTKLGIVKSAVEISSYRHDVAIRLSKSKISAASEEKDLLVKNAIDAIDEVDKSINVLVMRLREWYSIHHPSLSTIVEDQDQFARILKITSGKDSMNQKMLETAGLQSDMISQIINAIPGDIGGELRESDLAIIKGLANTISDLYEARKKLEGYVTEVMTIVAPNITALVGPLIGARLISLAGSLKDLARKPSSTVQVFGAEKALFRSLKTGADPPKHGIIYRVSEVHTSSYWQRGKIARALAGKLSIAARIDAYSDRNEGETLRQDFLERVEEIKKQNPNPPPVKPPKPKPEEKKRPQIRGRDRKGYDKKRSDYKKRGGGKR